MNIVVLVVLISGAALSARALNPPAPDPGESSFWTFVEKERRAVRVGPNGTVDTVSAPFETPKGTLIETPTELVVVSPGQVERMPKGTTDATRIQPAPAQEMAVPAGGVPRGGVYTYQSTGQIAIGPDVTAHVTAPVGDVVTDLHDVVWAEAGNELCRIEPTSGKQQPRPSCEKHGSDPRSGTFVVIDTEVYYVTAQMDTMALATEHGLAAAKSLGVDLPSDAVFTTFAKQRMFAAFLPTSYEVVLFSTEDGVKPIRRKVPPGSYRTIALGDGFFVLVDHAIGAAVIGDLVSGGIRTVPLRADAKLAEPSLKTMGDVFIEKDGGDRVYKITRTSVVEYDTGRAAREAAKKEEQPRASASPKPTDSPSTRPTGGPSRPAPPGAPAPAFAAPGDASATVMWTRPDANGADIRYYLVEWSSGTDRGSVRVAGGGSTDTRISGLANGVPYVFSVRAVNDRGPGAPAATAPVTPTPSVPGVPSGLTASVDIDATAQMRWERPPGDAASYRLIARGGGDSIVVDTGSTGTTAPLSEADGLTVGTMYAVTVAAVDSSGVSGAESSSVAITLAKPADPPATLNVVPSGSGTLRAQWAEPSMNGGTFDTYVVRLDGGIAPIEVKATSVVINGLANGRTYNVSVVARTKVGRRSAEGAAATTSATVGAPPAVSGVNAALSGDRQATVSFSVADNSSGAVTCHVYFDGVEGWTGGCAGSSSVSVGGLDYERSYDVWVVATNSYGSSPDSNHASVRTNNRPRVTVTKGGPKGCPGCTAVDVTLTDMAPNTSYVVECHSEVDGTAPFYTYTVRTDGNGYNRSSTCYFGYPGRAVWAVAGGVTSARVVW